MHVLCDPKAGNAVADRVHGQRRRPSRPGARGPHAGAAAAGARPAPLDLVRVRRAGREPLDRSDHQPGQAGGELLSRRSRLVAVGRTSADASDADGRVRTACARRPNRCRCRSAPRLERQIITIQPTRLLRVGNRWPKSDRPVVYLDEIAPDESSQEWGQLERNRSVWQKEMIIAGQPQRRGLGTHANSRIVYELSGGGFTKFRAVVGRDEHAGDGQIVFQVWLDGQCRFDSGPMTNATPGKPVEVDVAGAAVLELRTLDGGDGISGDHGNWADAQLLR